MRIAVFFDKFNQSHETKDPGQIVMGLRDLGVQSEMITIDKPSLREGNTSIPVRLLSKGQAADVEYWRSVPYDVMIAYTRLYSEIASTLKEAGKTVLVKADTDGRRIFPVYPRDMSYYTYKKATEKVKIFYKRFKRRLEGQRRANQLAEHIKLADGVVVESPQACANLSYILSYWEMPELIKKIFVIPNPVSNSFSSTSLQVKNKLIVAVGEWDGRVGNSYIKNTDTMVNVLCRFLIQRPDYEAVVIGRGDAIVRKFAERWSSRHKINFHITGFIPNSEVAQYLGKAQVLFMPSLYESFGIAAAEALCKGCSLVGSPIESFYFLAKGGSTGTLAPDFTEEAYLGALSADICKWERGCYSPQEISSLWYSTCNRKAIAEDFLRVIDKLGMAT